MTELDWSELTVAHRRIGSSVSESLQKLIVEGRFRPGDRLPPERELAQRFAASRASVRDALYELSLRGFIDRKPGRGTVVLDPQSQPEDLRDAFSKGGEGVFEAVDLRRVIEPSIAERAAARATSQDLDALAAILERSDGDISASASLELDVEFHLQLARASQNAHLVTLVQITSDWIRDLRALSHATKAGRRHSLADHRRIFVAVRNSDRDAAFAAMTTHILAIGERIQHTAARSDHDRAEARS